MEKQEYRYLLDWFLSFSGGFIAIAILGLMSQYGHFPTALIASLGSSAVTVFGVPHGQFSQPYNVLMGNLVSAFVAVTVVMIFPQQELMWLASSLTVGLVIMAMDLLKCMHPPGLVEMNESFYFPV